MNIAEINKVAESAEAASAKIITMYGPDQLADYFDTLATNIRLKAAERFRFISKHRLIKDIDYSFEDIRVHFYDKHKVVIAMQDFLDWRNAVYTGKAIEDTWVVDTEPNDEIREYLELDLGYNCELHLWQDEPDWDLSHYEE